MKQPRIALVKGPGADARRAHSTPTSVPLEAMADALQALAGPTCLAQAATLLATKFLKTDPTAPDWPDRDRLVLSAQEGPGLRRALGYLLGFVDRHRAPLTSAGDCGLTGIVTTASAPGKGIATAVDLAMAEQEMCARFGAALVKHHTYVLAGRDCLMKGIDHRAVDIAGQLRLGRLIVIWEAGPAEQLDQAEEAGWHVAQVDAGQTAQLERALFSARHDPRPSLVAYHAPGSELQKADHASAATCVGAGGALFEVPLHVLSAWRRASDHGRLARIKWETRLGCHPKRTAFAKALAG